MTDEQKKLAASPPTALDNQAQVIDAEFLRGLRVMAETTFPKECRTCGNVYQDSQDFIERTVGIGPKKGVKLGFDDDDARVLEFFEIALVGRRCTVFMPNVGTTPKTVSGAGSNSMNC
ncbi:MAG: hypothetical protein IPL29_07540 [Propionivibrio sp.]|nr:hypothetical protein [Propionivibrio sp.]